MLRARGHRAGDGPHEGDQFARDGRDDDVGMFTPRDEAPIALAQAHLRLPSEVLKGLRQLVDPLLDVGGHLGGIAIGPGGFHPSTDSSMDKREGIALLTRELDLFRLESYDELVDRIDRDPVTCERVGSTGVKYQLEIQFLWDAARGGSVRVMGSVDDGGWRAFVPITDSFIKAADGSFVGE